jgi:hypothetical protein
MSDEGCNHAFDTNCERWVTIRRSFGEAVKDPRSSGQSLTAPATGKYKQANTAS